MTIKDKKGWEFIESICLVSKNNPKPRYANLKWKIETDKQGEEFHKYMLTFSNITVFVDVKKASFSVREFIRFEGRYEFVNTRKVRLNKGKFSILQVKKGETRYTKEINLHNLSLYKDINSLYKTAKAGKVLRLIEGLFYKWEAKLDTPVRLLPQVKAAIKHTITTTKYKRRGYGEWRSTGSNDLLIKQLYSKNTVEAQKLHESIVNDRNSFVCPYIQYDCIKLRKGGWTYEQLFKLHSRGRYYTAGFADIFLTSKPEIVLKELESWDYMPNLAIYNQNFYIPFIGFEELANLNHVYKLKGESFFLKYINNIPKVRTYTKVDGTYIDNIPTLQLHPYYTFTKSLGKNSIVESLVTVPRFGDYLYIDEELWKFFINKEFNLKYLQEFITNLNKTTNSNFKVGDWVFIVDNGHTYVKVKLLD